MRFDACRHTGGHGGILVGAIMLASVINGPARSQVLSDAGRTLLAQAAASGTVELPTLDVQSRPGGPTQGLIASEASTGTKTGTPLVETPQSISVVPRATIDQRQAQTLGEALRYSSGVRTEAYGPDQRADWLLIRGFDAADTGLFLNGLRYNPGYAAGALETYGLQQYEVMRGPSSVLYGQIAPGGIINMVSRQPTQTPQGEVRLSAGSFGTAQAAGSSSGPLTQDGSLSYSLTGFGRVGETQVDRLSNDRAYLAPSLTWRPTNDTTVTFQGYYQRDRTQGGQFLPYLGTVRETTFGRISTRLNTGEPNFDKYDRTQYGLGYALEHRVNDVLSLRQNLRYAHVGINWEQVYGGGLAADERSLNRFVYNEDRSVNSFQVDNQAEAQFVTGPLRHRVLAGFDYAYAHFSSVQAFAFGPSLDVFSPSYGARLPQLGAPYLNQIQSRNQFGLYAQDQIRLGDHWALTLGVRQDWADADLKSRLDSSHQRQNESATTWRAGLVYLAPNGLAPYASYSTSFLPNIGTGANGQAFRATTGEQYEVGVKYQPPGRNSFMQAAAFQIRQQNALTTDANSVFFQAATGEIRVRGVELEGVANITPHFNLTASVTYWNPEVTKGNDTERGNRPAGVPKALASMYGDYTFDAGRLSGLGLGAGVRFVGNTATTAATAHNVVPSVTLMDAAVRYSLASLGRGFEPWQLAVNASNLFDTRYVSRCTSDSACFYGNRRTVLGSLIYRW